MFVFPYTLVKKLRLNQLEFAEAMYNDHKFQSENLLRPPFRFRFREILNNLAFLVFIATAILVSIKLFKELRRNGGY